jgi:phosphatidylinositol dimannoside acyltransferase
MGRQHLRKLILQTTLPVLRRLPYRVAISCLDAMGSIDRFTEPGRLRRYQRVVAESAERLGCRWNAPKVARALACQSYRGQIRDLLFDRCSDPQVEALFDVRGREHLEAAVALGKGVILLSNHNRSQLAMIHWLFRQGFPIRWFGEQPRNISRYLSRQFRTDGPLGQAGLFIMRRTAPGRSTPMVLQATRILNAGLVLAIAYDIRWRDGRAAPATFLGRTETYSTNWVNLAALTGAAIVPAFCRMGSRGTYHVDFRAHYHIPPNAIRDGRATPWVQEALNALEEQIRIHPEQSDDYLFWEPGDVDEASRADDASTSQHSRLGHAPSSALKKATTR